MIQLMKSSLIKREFPLTLIFASKIGIKTAMKIKGILEKESSLG
jgi:hypothetical protein